MVGDASATCPDCGETVAADRAKLCPTCGYPLTFDGSSRPAPQQPPGSEFLRQPGMAEPRRRRSGTREQPRWDPDRRAVDRVSGSPGPPQFGPRPAEQSLGPYCPGCGHRSAVGRVRCEVCGEELWPGAASPARRAVAQPGGSGPARRRRGGLTIAALVAVPIVAMLAVYGLMVMFS